jgi:hypothetical protein
MTWTALPFTRRTPPSSQRGKRILQYSSYCAGSVSYHAHQPSPNLNRAKTTRIIGTVMEGWQVHSASHTVRYCWPTPYRHYSPGGPSHDTIIERLAKTSGRCRRHFGRASGKRVPWGASEPSPGSGTWPPPITPPSSIVWWGRDTGASSPTPCARRCGRRRGGCAGSRWLRGGSYLPG